MSQFKDRKIEMVKVITKVGEFENVVEEVGYTHRFTSQSIVVHLGGIGTLDTTSLDESTFIPFEELNEDILYTWITGSITGSVWEDLEKTWESIKQPKYEYRSISSSFKEII